MLCLQLPHSRISFYVQFRIKRLLGKLIICIFSKMKSFKIKTLFITTYVYKFSVPNMSEVHLDTRIKLILIR